MDSHGKLPPDAFCTECGKQLDADGGHPAEMYLGTYNGLCYGCTSRGPYVARVAVLDGCQEVSWPPASPSYRRDRASHFGYPDCQACDGLGLVKPVYRGYDTGGKACEACLARYQGHPVRTWYWDRRRRIMEVAQEVFSRQVSELAGVPKRCSHKREQELREAFFASVGDEQAVRAWKKALPVKLRTDRLLAAHQRKGERLGVSQWTVPPELAASREAAVQRRVEDLKTRTFPVDTDDPCARGCGRKAAWLCKGTLLCAPCWTEQEQLPGHRRGLAEPHRFGTCGECTAWTVALWSWETAEGYYHRGQVSAEMWEAFAHVWATWTYRYSSTGAAYREPPSDPAVIMLTGYMREALAERQGAAL
jgi:hypothetical protein